MGCDTSCEDPDTTEILQAGPVNVESKVREAYESQGFATPQVVAQAPGRINLIGEHVDYCGGCVLPMALSVKAVIVGSFNDTKKCKVFSTSFGLVEFDLGEDGVPAKVDGDDKWTNYIRGVIAQHVKKEGCGITKGFECAVGTDVPMGAGLSSSAAFEVATALFLQKGNNWDVSEVDTAMMCQAAEHEYAGVPCGIMDQFISALGAEGNALAIDCKTNQYELIPLNDGTKCFVVANSVVTHSLGDGQYEKRVSGCEKGVEVLAKEGVSTKEDLRQVTVEDVEAKKTELIAAGGDGSEADGDVEYVYKYLKHVTTEMLRQEQAKEALKNGDYAKFGQLMNESHDSLRDDFKVSCTELDELVNIAREQGALGSRMSGGGFGGSMVTLVDADKADALIEAFKTQFSGYNGDNPFKEEYVFKSSPAAGAKALSGKDLYAMDFKPTTANTTAADWVGVYKDLFSPDDQNPDSRRFVEDFDGTLLVSADTGTEQWGKKFDSDTTVLPSLDAVPDVASQRKTSFRTKVPEDAPAQNIEEVKAGALDFTLTLGTSLGKKVIKWNGLYDGKGGTFAGKEVPATECDNFWEEISSE